MIKYIFLIVFSCLLSHFFRKCVLLEGVWKLISHRNAAQSLAFHSDVLFVYWLTVWRWLNVDRHRDTHCVRQFVSSANWKCLSILAQWRTNKRAHKLDLTCANRRGHHQNFLINSLIAISIAKFNSVHWLEWAIAPLPTRGNRALHRFLLPLQTSNDVIITKKVIFVQTIHALIARPKRGQ